MCHKWSYQTNHPHDLPSHHEPTEDDPIRLAAYERALPPPPNPHRLALVTRAIEEFRRLHADDCPWVTMNGAAR